MLNDSCMEQTFAANAETSYNLSFYEELRPGEAEGAGVSWTLTPGAGSLSGTASGIAAAPGADGWEQFSYTFTPSTATNVTFNVVIYNWQFGYGVYFDDVVVAAARNPGDVNGDGAVDINDLTIVLANFGQTGCTWSQGCVDGDPTGTVDVNDLTIVLSSFGTTYSAGLAAVPEPSALVLVVVGILGLLGFARQRRSR
jgi:hypothetical protein